MILTLAPCPHCGGHTTAQREAGDHRVTAWQVQCDAEDDSGTRGCGYRGPRAIELVIAIRWHNKIAQNCGAAA